MTYWLKVANSGQNTSTSYFGKRVIMGNINYDTSMQCQNIYLTSEHKYERIYMYMDEHIPQTAKVPNTSSKAV